MKGELAALGCTVITSELELRSEAGFLQMRAGVTALLHQICALK